MKYETEGLLQMQEYQCGHVDLPPRKIFLFISVKWMLYTDLYKTLCIHQDIYEDFDWGHDIAYKKVSALGLLCKAMGSECAREEFKVN